ncbi:MAG: hypothetical protein L0Z53_06650 [Acidobacteriales bacterium]|nr:hypothetical protein [Terriglobales bacterium]
MSETPRKRLSKLLEGLELPKGFKLTPTRERMLKKLGETMLKEPVHVVGSRVMGSRLRPWGTTSGWGRAEFGAFKAMGKAGWVSVRAPVSMSYWGRNELVWQPSIEGLAKRLGMRSKLWEERKAQSVQGHEEANREIAGRLWEARRVINEATLHPTLGEHDMLNAYRKVKELMQQAEHARREVEEAQAKIEQVPEPSEEEALTALMVRELSRERK